MQAPLAAAGTTLSASICYEDAYGSAQLPTVRRSGLLVNVTNDAWFGRSSARDLHFQIARMRAIEARRFMLRAANDGISAVIDPQADVVAVAPEFEPAVLRAHRAATQRRHRPIWSPGTGRWWRFRSRYCWLSDCAAGVPSPRRAPL